MNIDVLIKLRSFVLTIGKFFSLNLAEFNIVILCSDIGVSRLNCAASFCLVLHCHADSLFGEALELYFRTLLR